MEGYEIYGNVHLGSPQIALLPLSKKKSWVWIQSGAFLWGAYFTCVYTSSLWTLQLPPIVQTHVHWYEIKSCNATALFFCPRLHCWSVFCRKHFLLHDFGSKLVESVLNWMFFAMKSQEVVWTLVKLLTAKSFVEVEACPLMHPTYALWFTGDVT